MVFTCERKQMVAGQAILSETATKVQSQEDALEDIVRRHARLVYRIVYGVLRNHHEAEDARFRWRVLTSLSKSSPLRRWAQRK